MCTVPMVFLHLCVSKNLGSSKKIPTPCAWKTPDSAMHMLFILFFYIERFGVLGGRSDPETCRIWKCYNLLQGS